MYGKRLMDAFDAEGRVSRGQDDFETAFVMSAMENAVNNYLHGATPAELRVRVLRHIADVLADERIQLSDTERTAYEYATLVVESVD